MNTMENFSMILCFALILLLCTYHSAFIIILNKKRKELIKDYEKLLHLKDWYEKISEEASRSFMMERIDKKGQELINQLDLLNAKLLKIQEKHNNLQKNQEKLHHNLLEEHKLLNQYFENYS